MNPTNPIKVILLLNNQILVSQIEEIPSELGEPDCKLISPFLIKSNPIEGLSPTLESWIGDYSSQDIFKIHSDKILTITDPKPTLLEKYQNLIK